ncbi:unnamed protein product [Cuscuta epithymum]|uniref:Uncharacterized protein n=1 Tax=Cuscuta epithymum TaxID=186058 RepID=A0AAV0F4H9_9ASTE|nr:unnamed protein product [Cuscuta epithymum]
MDGRNFIEERPPEVEGHTSNDVRVNVRELIRLMQSKVWEQQKLIGKSVDRNDCCIFGVPQGFTDSEVDARTFQPRTVSIGPYHRGKPHLREMEKHKWRFLERAIRRTATKNGADWEDYVTAVEGLAAVARASYSEDITALKGDEFVEMLVVVEMFLAFTGVDCFHEDDPFRSMQWIQYSLHEDFLCLEDQIPYIVLQKLFDLTTEGWNNRHSLSDTALEFFNNNNALGHDLECLHLLDLVRKSYIPKTYNKLGFTLKTHCILEMPGGTSLLKCFPIIDWELRHLRIGKIESISKLRRAGIKLKLNRDWKKSFLAVKFKRGVIWMPRVALDDTAFLLNCVAFEQCHGEVRNVVSAYAVFLSCLIRTDKDVDILREAHVLDHSLGTTADVVAFVGRLGRAAACDVTVSYLRHVFGGVNMHYDSHWHVWANFKYENFDTYFSSPWKVTSLCAALFLIVLTTIQTLIAISDYFKKGKFP